MSTKEFLLDSHGAQELPAETVQDMIDLGIAERNSLGYPVTLNGLSAHEAVEQHRDAQPDRRY